MTDQRGIEAAKKAFYRNMDPGLGVEEAISAYLATTEPGKPESGRRPVDLPRAYIDAVSAYRRYDDDFNGDGLMAAVKTVLSLSALSTPPQPEACEPVAWLPKRRWEQMTAAEPWLTNIVYSEDQGKFFECVPLYASPTSLGVDIEEVKRVLKPFADEAAAYDPDTGDGDDICCVTPAYFKIRDLRKVRSILSKIEGGVDGK